MLRSRFERNGEVIDEERRGYSPQDLVDYLVDEYNKRAGWLKERPGIYGGGLRAEDIFLEYVVDVLHAGIIHTNGTLYSFINGDFGHLYQALILCLLCCSAGEINQCLRKNRGFAVSGMDHGVFIVGLLHDNEGWKDKALADAHKFLQGKRTVADRALTAYLIALYEGDAAGLSDNLQILMDNYLKGGLVMGDAFRVPLHGLYLMAHLYLPENIFREVLRPAGPGWWNEHIDMCLQFPMAALMEPYVVFPPPLSFMNEAITAIDNELPQALALTPL